MSAKRSKKSAAAGRGTKAATKNAVRNKRTKHKQAKKKAQVKSTRAHIKRKSKRPARKKARDITSRVYTKATLGKLFGLSCNQCAFPNCSNPIIIAGDEVSNEAIIGHVCHIYAASDNGPRGKRGLTAKQRNAFKNLILMCRDHHGRVDTQYKSYPAVTLFKWKKDHEAKATKGTPQALKEEALVERHHFFEEFSDEQIKAELRRIRQARLLNGFDVVTQAKQLARHVREARLSGGSSENRATALAWCARLLARGDTLQLAKELLHDSVAMETTPEAEIAKAFITAASSVQKAMAALAAIKTPQARSAQLILQVINKKSKTALKWAQDAGLSIDDFCADGKYTLLAHTLTEHQWSQGRTLVDRLAESDLQECPPLMFLAALSRLLCAVTDEAKPVAFTQIPFDVDTFPLASRPEDLAERREARALFARVAKFAYSVEVNRSGDGASDYALWLGLADPDQSTHAAAITELQGSMSDPTTAIRRLNLAIRFGLKPDLVAAEERLDKSVLFSGKATLDEAVARFALALTKKTPKLAAEYIALHRSELLENLDPGRMSASEIELLVRAGLIDSARKRLKEAVRKGYVGQEKKQLEQLIAGGLGADGIRKRREAYDGKRNLPNLLSLIYALEEARLWEDLLPYAQDLFRLSPSVNSLDRVVHALHELGRHAEVYAQLSTNLSLVEQSEKLKTIWAWELFREGRLQDAEEALEKTAEKNDTNARGLKVNLAITSGEWHDLVAFCQTIWEERESQSAADLMHAAQLSIAVQGAHSRELVEAALQKEPENPALLAKAYFEATSVGWEQSPQISDWLKRAAQLSSDDGPIQSMSLREVLDRKPKWDEQVANTWNELAKGRIPTVAAGQIINRTLVDLYLLPSLANMTVTDVRRRAIVFAYSGARRVVKFPQPKSVALDFAALVTFSRLGLLEALLALYTLVVPHATLGWLFQERRKAVFHQPSRIKDAQVIKQLVATGYLDVIRPPPSRDEKLRNHVGADLAAMLYEAREKSSRESQVLVVRSAPLHRLSADFSEEADITGYEKYICSCSAVIDRMVLKALLTRAEEEKARDYFNLTERRWPNEPTIDDGTEVYLDDVSVAYFHATGVLDKFQRAGIKAYISNQEDSEANGLLAIDRLGSQQLKYLEDIRSVLASGIKSGRVTLGRTNDASQTVDVGTLHPTYTALNLANAADVLVVDDRALNHIQGLNGETRVTAVLCSLDVLDLMCEAGALSQGEVFEHRTTLRRAGYQLMPLTYEELQHHLKSAQVIDDEFVENAELRAIRESLLRARMGAIVQLPAEMEVVNKMLAALTRSILNTWERVPDSKEAQIRCDYLLGIVDPRNWAASAEKPFEKTFAQSAYGAYALQLIRTLVGADAATHNAYFEWVTTRVIRPIKEYQPEIYASLMASYRAWVVSQSDALALAYEAQK